MTSKSGFVLLDLTLVRDGLKATYCVSEESRFFDGHFVDRMVFPGVGMLGMVTDAVARTPFGAAGFLGGLRRVKFRRLVETPGVFVVDLVAGPSPEDWLFKISIEGDLVADGACSVELREHGVPESSDGGGTINLDLEELIPHRKPMRLLDEAVAMKEGCAVTRSTVQDDWPLVHGGTVPGVLLVETIAQTASSLIGWERRTEESIGGRGYLVGIRKAHFNVARLPVGLRIQNRVTAVQRRGVYAVFEGLATVDDFVLCEMVIQALRPE